MTVFVKKVPSENVHKWTFPEALTRAELEAIFKDFQLCYQHTEIQVAYLDLMPEDAANGVTERYITVEIADHVPNKMCTQFTKVKGETEELPITFEEYKISVDKKRDLVRTIIVKHRYRFWFGSNYFDLDIFESPSRQACILTLEALSGVDLDRVEIPDFFGQLRVVTDDLDFTDSVISIKPW